MYMPDENAKDKIARQDHDTLIRVEVTVNNMAQDLKALSDGLSLRLTGVEQRLTAMELLANEVKPKEMMLKVASHGEDIQGLKTTWRTIVFICSTAAALLGILLTVLNQFFGLFK